ncbi:MAG: hypothetical protein LBR56_02230 [Sporomusaceae bacterium]|jgi:hypothetical protein|nr:hypothetical protein [Sporomusaceae bacterium]
MKLVIMKFTKYVLVAAANTTAININIAPNAALRLKCLLRTAANITPHPVTATPVSYPRFNFTYTKNNHLAFFTAQGNYLGIIFFCIQNHASINSAKLAKYCVSGS